MEYSTINMGYTFYWYVRRTEWWNQHSAVKLGQTKNLKGRESTYKTGEIIKGEYTLVIKCKVQSRSKRYSLDVDSKDYFAPRHIDLGGGSEFYHESVVDDIIPWLISHNLDIQIITEPNKEHNVKPNILQRFFGGIRRRNIVHTPSETHALEKQFAQMEIK